MEKFKIPPAVSVNFIYFGEKDEIYARRSMLGKFFNPENSRPIIIKERLPQKNIELKQMVEKRVTLLQQRIVR